MESVLLQKQSSVSTSLLGRCGQVGHPTVSIAIRPIELVLHNQIPQVKFLSDFGSEGVGETPASESGETDVVDENQRQVSEPLETSEGTDQIEVGQTESAHDQRQRRTHNEHEDAVDDHNVQWSVLVSGQQMFEPGQIVEADERGQHEVEDEDDLYGRPEPS